jgi:hypothetical protein
MKEESEMKWKNRLFTLCSVRIRTLADNKEKYAVKQYTKTGCR